MKIVKVLVKQLKERDPYAIMVVIIGAALIAVVVWAILF